MNNQVYNTKIINIKKNEVNSRGFDLEIENQGFDKLEVQLGCDNKQENRDLESDLEIIMDNNETHLACDNEQRNQDLGSELEKVSLNVEVQLGCDNNQENQDLECDKSKVQLGCDNKQENRDLESELEIILDSNERHLGFDIEQGNRDLGSELEKMWMIVELQLIDQVPIKGLLNLVHF